MSDKPPRVRRTQDPTGHITLDTQQTGLIKEINRKAAILDFKHRTGQIEFRYSRNPLTTFVKSPRHDYRNFVFDPPPAPEVKEKWVYPEPGNDWGLLGKLQTQKKLYANIYAKEQEYKSKLIEAQNILSSSTTRISSPLSAPLISSRNFPSSREILTSRSSMDTKRSDFSDFQITSRNPDNYSTNKNLNTNNNTNILSNSASLPVRISQLKELALSHPEVIDKSRADRASHFISTQKHPLEPPTGRELAHGSFKPAGTHFTMKPTDTLIATKKKSHLGKSTLQLSSPNFSPGHSETTMKFLMNELTKTDEEIERQELLIGLKKSKLKGFEAPISSRN